MKVTANYATHPGQGRFAALRKSVESIIDQVDQVRIYWNISNYLGIPDWFRSNDKIVNFVGDNLTDNGKFFSLLFCGDEYYFSCDDDLIYPPGYVEYMRKMLMNSEGVVSLHGRELKTTGDYKNLYYYGAHWVWSYLNDVDEEKDVDVVGTGVTAIDTRRFKPALIARCDRQKMSDLVFSYYAAKSKIKMTVLPHKGAWVKPIRMESSIYSESYKSDQSKQCEIVVEIMKLKGII